MKSLRSSVLFTFAVSCSGILGCATPNEDDAETTEDALQIHRLGVDIVGSIAPGETKEMTFKRSSSYAYRGFSFRPELGTKVRVTVTSSSGAPSAVVFGPTTAGGDLGIVAVASGSAVPVAELVTYKSFEHYAVAKLTHSSNDATVTLRFEAERTTIAGDDPLPSTCARASDAELTDLTARISDGRSAVKLGGFELSTFERRCEPQMGCSDWVSSAFTTTGAWPSGDPRRGWLWIVREGRTLKPHLISASCSDEDGCNRDPQLPLAQGSYLLGSSCEASGDVYQCSPYVYGHSTAVRFSLATWYPIRYGTETAAPNVTLGAHCADVKMRGTTVPDYAGNYLEYVTGATVTF